MSKGKTLEELHEAEEAAWRIYSTACQAVRIERDKAVALLTAENVRDIAHEAWHKALYAHERAIRKAEKKARLAAARSEEEE